MMYDILVSNDPIDYFQSINLDNWILLLYKRDRSFFIYSNYGAVDQLCWPNSTFVCVPWVNIFKEK